MITLDHTALRLAVLAAALSAAACGTSRTTSATEVPQCQSCHGGANGNAAPPGSVLGETATTSLAVGAHQAHLTRAHFRPVVACGECHVVPATAADHVDGEARVTFSGGATLGGATPAWNRTTATCSGVYCHGDTLGAGGTFTRPVWNAPGQAALTCASCHGHPPDRHGAAATDCSHCHPATVLPAGTIDVAGGKHINGHVETAAHPDCAGCHGNPPARHGPNATNCNACHPLTVTAAGEIDVAGGHHRNGIVEVVPSPACNGCHDAPPAIGAHLAHVGLVPPGLTYGEQWRTADLDPTGGHGVYTFGCGACHPADPAKHRNGVVDVDLSPVGAPAGSLKTRNAPTAAYAQAGGTCSGIYCHSSGQATPSYATTPGWASGQKPGCGGCHGNPPVYANAGPGAAGANSHIYLNWYGSEGGHFGGLPGPSYHHSRHGSPSSLPTGMRASPVTCQACHAATVDPTNVLAGGLFYLDATQTTQLPGGDPARFTDAFWKDTQCVTCHSGRAGAPPVGGGKVRPLHHVDGSRDVVFDDRSAPAGYFASLGLFAPARPYFMTDAYFPTGTAALPATAGWSPAAPTGAGKATLSYRLTGATYEPATKTCNSVACHLGNAVRWGQQDFQTSPPTCTGCHPLR